MSAMSARDAAFERYLFQQWFVTDAIADFAIADATLRLLLMPID